MLEGQEKEQIDFQFFLFFFRMDVERSPLCLYDYIQIGGTRICGPFKGYMIAPYDQGLIGKKI